MSINLLQRRRSMMGQKGGSLPYDSKVEYLGLDGNQYLSSGYTATNNSKIKMEFSYSVGTGFPLFGRNAYSGNGRIVSQCKGGSAVSHKFGPLSKTRNVQTSVTSVQLDSSYLKIGGTNYDWDGTLSDFTGIGDLLIGWDNYANTKFQGKIKSFKIWESDTLVRDMIPVRVGTTGYLYDTVSGELFENLGTGDFTLGPDVTQ